MSEGEGRIARLRWQLRLFEQRRTVVSDRLRELESLAATEAGPGEAEGEAEAGEPTLAALYISAAKDEGEDLDRQIAGLRAELGVASLIYGVSLSDDEPAEPPPFVPVPRRVRLSGPVSDSVAAINVLMDPEPDSVTAADAPK